MDYRSQSLKETDAQLSAPPTAVLTAAAGYPPSGPKVCAQCGTTRTPQWREGPKGPKTLCNACGVKRVRQLRTSSEGGKRKAVKALGPTYEDCTEIPAASEQNAPCATLQRRPSRKVTNKAVGRAAEEAFIYAEWREEGENQPCRSTEDTGSADVACQHSDSAEEVAWVPDHSSLTNRRWHAGPVAETVGQDCAAAVDLLSMSVLEDAQLACTSQQRESSVVASHDIAQINTSSYAQMANRALKCNSHLPSHVEAQTLVQEALRTLPQDQRSQVLAAKAELDSASREAAAADAAVAAVAKILAIKQAGATRARASAAKAARQIHTFMSDMEAQYGWSLQASKRQQTSH